jgi:hypothetical protein
MPADILSAMIRASGPEILTMPIADSPIAVAIAAIECCQVTIGVSLTYRVDEMNSIFSKYCRAIFPVFLIALTALVPATAAGEGFERVFFLVVVRSAEVIGLQKYERGRDIGNKLSTM